MAIAAVLPLMGMKAGIVALAISLALLAAPLTPWLFMIFLVALLGLCALMSENSVEVGVKVYGADALVFFLFLSMVSAARRPGLEHGSVDHPAGERLIVALLVLGIAYGAASTGMGLLHGFSFNDSLGDFRRYYFYPLAMLPALLLRFERKQLRLLPWAIAAGAALVILTGCYRLMTGRTWQEEYFLGEPGTAWTIQLRLLSQTEITTMGLALAFFLAEFQSPRRWPLRVVNGAAAGITLIMLVLSGWRLALLYIAIAPLATFYLLGRIRQQPLTSLAMGVFSIALAGAAAVAGAALLVPDMVTETIETLRQRTVERAISEDLRYYAWAAAWQHFTENPVFGTGLGHQLGYYAKLSNGEFAYVESTTHNAYLTLLYRSGLIGFVFLAGLHLAFIVHVHRHLRGLAPEFQSSIVGILAGYAAIAAVHFVQPLQTGAAVSLYLVMGIAMRLVRDTALRRQPVTAPPSPDERLPATCQA